MPKIEEFYQIQYKRWSATRHKRLRCASDTITLGTLAHFRHFKLKGTVRAFFTVFEDNLLFLR
jgi:hypothetical protein